MRVSEDKHRGTLIAFFTDKRLTVESAGSSNGSYVASSLQDPLSTNDVARAASFKEIREKQQPEGTAQDCNSLSLIYSSSSSVVPSNNSG